MKKLLLILLCLPMFGFGQIDDIVKIQSDVENINYRMDKHHKQFYNGVTLSLVGLGATAFGVLVSVNPIIYIGSALVLSGNIVSINSHKWFEDIELYELQQVQKYKIKKRVKELDKLLESGEITKKEYHKAIKDLKALKQ